LQGPTELGSGLAIDGGRILENAGTLTWNGGSLLIAGGDASQAVHSAELLNAAGATLLIDGTASINSQGNASVLNAGTILLAGGTGNSQVYANVNNSGTIAVSAGTLTLEQGASGPGTFLLDGDAVLDFAGAVTGGATMQFLHAGGTLETAGTGLFGATVSGFGGSDVLDAAAVVYSASDTKLFSGGTLTVSDGTHTALFGLTGNYTSGGTFHLATDGHGGTAITFG
jgi:hypothetical protein